MPVTDAGQVIEPLVSVPIATSTIPDATATAEPELDPHGLYFESKLCVVCPLILDQPLTDLVERKFAHSDKFALPLMRNPFLRSLSIRNAFSFAILFSKAKEPADVTKSFISILSLITISM